MSCYVQSGGGDPIVTYGKESARFLIARSRALPPRERKAALKKVLDAIDPSLWSRAEHRAGKAMGVGMPPEQALERGLAAAMSDGAIRELVQVGQKKQAPRLRSLLGMGCFGCGAVLGDIADGLVLTSPTKTVATAPVSREHRGTDATDRTGHVIPTTGTGPALQTGPFVFGTQGGGIMLHTPATDIPATWKTYFATEIGKLLSLAGPKAVMVTAGSLGLDRWLGMPASSMVPANFFNGSLPAFKTTNPTDPTGNWGIYFIASPTTLGVALRKIPPPETTWLGRLWTGIKNIPSRIASAGGAVYDYAKDAAGWLKDQACRMANSSTITSAAAAGGMAVGGPAGAAAASTGASIVAGLCASPGAEVPITEPAPASSNLLPLVLIGGGAAALLLLSR